MARKVSEKTDVAYFDHTDYVDEPGFYVVEKESQDNDGVLLLGKRVWPSPDGEGFVHDEPSEGGEE